MKHWTEILGCYDPELNPLADLVGDFDASSREATDTWRVNQWRQIAGMMGWPSAFERARLAAASSPGGLGTLTDAAVEAFTQWLAHNQRDMPHLERARVRHQSLAAIDAIGMEAHALFRVNVLSTRLPDSACFAREERLPVIVTPAPDRPAVIATPATSPRPKPIASTTLTDNTDGQPSESGFVDAQQQAKLHLQSILGIASKAGPRGRAFRAEAGHSYFGLPHPTKPSGCAYPIQLSLGTFPWVYGNMLGREAPGLRWAAGRPWRPASLGLRIMVSLWSDPAVNLSQDARLVAAQYRHFRSTTNELLADVPVWTEATAGIAGRLYRWRGYLYVHQGSSALARLKGARGVVAASSYNYIKRCFARFFCARRAYVRALGSLSSDARDAYARNPDPCTRRVEAIATIAV